MNFYKPSDVAERLGLTTDMVRSLIRNRELGCICIGKQYRITDEHLAEFIQRHERPAKPVGAPSGVASAFGATARSSSRRRAS